MTVLVAVVAAIVAGWLLVPAPAGRGIERLDGEHAAGGPAVPPQRLLCLLVPAASGAVVGGIAATVEPGLTGPVVGAVTVVLTATVTWLAACWWRRRRADRMADEIAHGCQVLAGQLRIGLVPTEALAIAAEDCPALREGRAMQQLGGDVVRLWESAAQRPGEQGLRALARAWWVSERTGAPLADLVARVSDNLDRDRRVTALVESELAGSRASARLMSLLPAAGVGLGVMLHADPLGFLLHHPVGLASLFVGVSLACAGLVWVDRIAAAVHSPRTGPRTVGRA